jgi:hypothetical protein
MAQQDEILAGFEAKLARVLVSVPRAWLVEEAPETLDWTDPTSLDWLKGPRMKALQAAMSNAVQPEQVSGN